MNCRNERKWRNDRCSETQFMQLRKEAWKKNSGLQNPWPRDYQCDGLPSYEATDIGSWSIVGSYVPVKEVSVNDIWNKSYMNAEKEMKWRNNRRSEMQFMQLRKEAWKKFRTSTGFEPMTSWLLVWWSTNWAMKPLMLGAGQFWVHMFPWKKWVLMIWTAEMKWNQEMIVAVKLNLCNCVKKLEKNAELQWGLNPWPHDYQCDALPTELWSHWHLLRYM